VLDEAIALGALSQTEAIEAAEHILYQNASRLYQVTV
jgi:hypothetical protein